jgi:hypothetical protein
MQVTINLNQDTGYDDLALIATLLAERNDDAKRRLYLWGADCAARVLPIWQYYMPGDECARQAIEATRQYARGLIHLRHASRLYLACEAACNRASNACWRVPWDAAWDAGRAAARDAICDHAWEGGSPSRASIRESARAAAEAVARHYRSGAAHAAERNWQFNRLIERLNDPEPADWPLERDHVAEL